MYRLWARLFGVILLLGLGSCAKQDSSIGPGVTNAVTSLGSVEGRALNMTATAKVTRNGVEVRELTATVYSGGSGDTLEVIGYPDQGASLLSFRLLVRSGSGATGTYNPADTTQGPPETGKFVFAMTREHSYSSSSSTCSVNMTNFNRTDRLFTLRLTGQLTKTPTSGSSSQVPVDWTLTGSYVRVSR